MATSPALDVPPEQPPHKRQKTATTSSPASPPTTDLASHLDTLERSKYRKGAKLGSGQYADVFSATLISDSTQLVAIKKIKVGPEAQHPNIIKLHAVFSTKNQNLNLVLEHLPQGDLLKLIQDTANISYTPADIKAWMLQLMRATWFCHQNYILHRDIKPNNLLIAANGEIKLADFGLARSFADPFQPMTYNTITIWYRPPELFFQAQFYGDRVDIWSCGCVFAELVARDVLFRAWPETEMGMVKLICEKVGTPTESNWPGVSKLKGYVTPSETTPLRPFEYWKSQFRAIGDVGMDLLMKMLTLDPRKRFSAEMVLRHGYWTAEPRPSRLEDLPRKGGGAETMAEDLTRRGGEVPDVNGKGGKRGDVVARKIDFGGMG
ncbi:TFIIH complex serine/threonine-protein kinase subunit kin28 [Vermiconidia calcicola]|uniref:TFIIH complex serine/threonine-protein kinase subunit kin28 n=1 Tax=Vermiconidia calcicola TaxID=1690605 RepID=A0ACC3MS46_9PEZI|nr:TFIIH complex serine/threonine-protein kinase subunit kin28 [Vermiconidia calcicola]